MTAEEHLEKLREQLPRVLHSWLARISQNAPSEEWNMCVRQNRQIIIGATYKTLSNILCNMSASNIVTLYIE